VLEIRVGTRPATPDGRPILGPVPGWSNAFVAAGHGAEGLLLGPYSAHLMARHMAGRPLGDDPEAQATGERVLERCRVARVVP